MLQEVMRLDINQCKRAPQASLEPQLTRLGEDRIEAVRKLLRINGIVTVAQLPTVIQREQGEASGSGPPHQLRNESCADVLMKWLPRVIYPWLNLYTLGHDAIAHILWNSPVGVRGCSALVKQHGNACSLEYFPGRYCPLKWKQVCVIHRGKRGRPL